MLEFTFLGTSSGIPTLQRNVSALAIKRKGTKSWCLVDCGEGTQQQLLRTSYSLTHLDTIFISHVHGDHCYGLPGLVATTAMTGRTEPLRIVAPYGVKEFLLNAMKYTDMHISYDVEFISSEESKNILVDSNFEVTPCPLSHRVPSYGYQFKEIVNEAKLDVNKLIEDKIPQGPLWGRIVKEDIIKLENGSELKSSDYILKPRKPLGVIVGGDNDTPELLNESASNIEVLIHEATYCQDVHLKVGPKSQHSDAARVAKFANSAKIKNLILTHFSARYHKSTNTTVNAIDNLEKDAKKHYHGPLFLAKDFDHFSLDNNGKLFLIE